MAVGLPDFIENNHNKQPDKEQGSEYKKPEVLALENALEELSDGASFSQPRDRGSAHLPNTSQHLSKDTGTARISLGAEFEDVDTPKENIGTRETVEGGLRQQLLHSMKHGIVELIYNSREYLSSILKLSAIRKLQGEREALKNLREAVLKGDFTLILNSPILGRASASLTPQQMASEFSLLVKTKALFITGFLKKATAAQEALEDQKAILFQVISGLYRERQVLSESTTADNLRLYDFYLELLSNRLMETRLDEKFIDLIRHGASFHEEHVAMLDRIWDITTEDYHNLEKDVTEYFLGILNVHDQDLSQRIAGYSRQLSGRDRIELARKIKETYPMDFAINEYLRLHDIHSKDFVSFRALNDTLSKEIPDAMAKLNKLFVTCIPVETEPGVYSSRWLVLENLKLENQYGLRLSEDIKSCIARERHAARTYPLHICGNWAIADISDAINITEDHNALEALQGLVQHREEITTLENLTNTLEKLIKENKQRNVHRHIPKYIDPDELLDLYLKSPNHKEKDRHLHYPNTIAGKNHHALPCNVSFYKTLQAHNAPYVQGSVTAKITHLSDPKPSFTIDQNFPSISTGLHIQSLHEDFFTLNSSHPFSDTLQNCIKDLPMILGKIPEDVANDWFKMLVKQQYIDVFEHFSALYPEKFQPISAKPHLAQSLKELDANAFWELTATIATLDTAANPEEYKQLQDDIIKYRRFAFGTQNISMSQLIEGLPHDPMRQSSFNTEISRMADTIITLATSPKHKEKFYQALSISAPLSTAFDRMLQALSPADKATFLRETYIFAIAVMGHQLLENDNIVSNERLYQNEEFIAFAYEYVFYIFSGLSTIKPTPFTELPLRQFLTIHKSTPLPTTLDNSLPLLKEGKTTDNALVPSLSNHPSLGDYLQNINLTPDVKEILKQQLEQEASRLGLEISTRNWFSSVLVELYPNGNIAAPDHLEEQVKRLVKSQSTISKHTIKECLELHISEIITRAYESKHLEEKEVMNTIKTPLLADHLLQSFEKYEKNHNYLKWQNKIILYDALLNNINNYPLEEEGARDAIDISTYTIDDQYNILKQSIDEARETERYADLEFTVYYLFKESIDTALESFTYKNISSPDINILKQQEDKDLSQELKKHLKENISTAIREVSREIYSSTDRDSHIVQRVLNTKNRLWFTILEKAIIDAISRTPLHRLHGEMAHFFNNVSEDTTTTFTISLENLDDYEPKDNPLRKYLFEDNKEGLRTILNEKYKSYTKLLIDAHAVAPRRKGELTKEDAELLYNHLREHPEILDRHLLVATKNARANKTTSLLNQTYLHWLLHQQTKKTEPGLLTSELQLLADKMEKDKTYNHMLAEALMQNQMLSEQLASFFQATITTPDQCPRMFLGYQGTDIATARPY